MHEHFPHEQLTPEDIINRHKKIVAEARKLYPGFAHIDDDFSGSFELADEVLGDIQKYESSPLALAKMRIAELSSAASCLIPANS